MGWRNKQQTLSHTANDIDSDLQETGMRNEMDGKLAAKLETNLSDNSIDAARVEGAEEATEKTIEQLEKELKQLENEYDQYEEYEDDYDENANSSVFPTTSTASLAADVLQGLAAKQESINSTSNKTPVAADYAETTAKPTATLMAKTQPTTLEPKGMLKTQLYTPYQKYFRYAMC